MFARTWPWTVENCRQLSSRTTWLVIWNISAADTFARYFSKVQSMISYENTSNCNYRDNVTWSIYLHRMFVHYHIHLLDRLLIVRWNEFNSSVTSHIVSLCPCQWWPISLDPLNSVATRAKVMCSLLVIYRRTSMSTRMDFMTWNYGYIIKSRK
jgi:hypothetical protein